MDLEEKIVLVFGGSSGIGAALCDCLLQSGVKVCCADINPETIPFGDKYKKDRYIFTKADVTSTDSIEGAFQCVLNAWQKTTDIVINCCGIVHEFQFEKCIEVNFTGTVRTLLSSLRHMGRDKGGQGGSYLSVSSINSLIECPFAPIYAATKAGINQITRAYAAEYHFSKHGVRINTILPGAVTTPMQDKVTPDTCFVLDGFLAKRNKFMSSDYVAQNIVDIVRNPDMNGQCMLLTRLGGLETVQFDKEEEYQSKIL